MERKENVDIKEEFRREQTSGKEEKAEGKGVFSW